MPKPRGPFADLSCPWCGQSDSSFTVKLADLEAVSCDGCGESFTVHQAVVRAEQVLLGWSAYEQLTRLAPAVAADPAGTCDPPPPERRRHHDASGAPRTLDLPRGYKGPGVHFGDGEDVPARPSVKAANGE